MFWAADAWKIKIQTWIGRRAHFCEMIQKCCYQTLTHLSNRNTKHILLPKVKFTVNSIIIIYSNNLFLHHMMGRRIRWFQYTCESPGLVDNNSQLMYLFTFKYLIFVMILNVNQRFKCRAFTCNRVLLHLNATHSASFTFLFWLNKVILIFFYLNCFDMLFMSIRCTLRSWC